MAKYNEEAAAPSVAEARKVCESFSADGGGRVRRAHAEAIDALCAAVRAESGEADQETASLVRLLTQVACAAALMYPTATGDGTDTVQWRAHLKGEAWLSARGAR